LADVSLTLNMTEFFCHPEPLSCHPERSEGSAKMQYYGLGRCFAYAQHDRVFFSSLRSE